MGPQDAVFRRAQAGWAAVTMDWQGASGLTMRVAPTARPAAGGSGIHWFFSANQIIPALASNVHVLRGGRVVGDRGE